MGIRINTTSFNTDVEILLENWEAARSTASNNFSVLIPVLAEIKTTFHIISYCIIPYQRGVVGSEKEEKNTYIKNSLDY